MNSSTVIVLDSFEPNLLTFNKLLLTSLSPITTTNGTQSLPALRIFLPIRSCLSSTSTRIPASLILSDKSNAKSSWSGNPQR